MSRQQPIFDQGISVTARMLPWVKTLWASVGLSPHEFRHRASAVLDRLLHHSHVLKIRAESYGLKEKR